ncbi:MAG: hypothetical protein CR993_01740 [Rhodobacterales bacterium]|nr:MAG: hypothetical protein CR993_01740 [Rhodobacterales bacterium]
MKPNFALDLGHDSIRLLARQGKSWALVGSVSLDDPDLPARLGELRGKAESIAAGEIRTKLVIPNSQILYTTLPANAPDDIGKEVQIREGLEGLTPYAVGDLVFDWRADGKEARVAVLAHETMDEAESFAAEYGFNPVSFVARPAKGTFKGEPFFGISKATSALLAAGEKVARDSRALPANPAPLAPEEAPTDTHSEPAPEPAAGPTPEPEKSSEHPPEPTAESAVEPISEPTPEPTTEPSPEPIPDPAPEAVPEPAPEPEFDPFAALDEVPDPFPAEPAPKKQSPKKRSSGKAAKKSAKVEAPALDPFPPTPDDIPTAKPVPKPGSKRKKSAPTPDTPPSFPLLDDLPPPPAEDSAASQPDWSAPEAPAALETPAAKAPMTFSSRRSALPDWQKPDDSRDTAPKPRLPQSPKAAPETAKEVPPAKASITIHPPIYTPTETPDQLPSEAGNGARKPDLTDRVTPAPIVSPPDPDSRRAAMAAALAKPLPGQKTKPKPKKPGPLAGIGTALTGTLSGLFGRKKPRSAADHAVRREMDAALTAPLPKPDPASQPAPSKPAPKFNPDPKFKLNGKAGPAETVAAPKTAAAPKVEAPQAPLPTPAAKPEQPAKPEKTDRKKTKKPAKPGLLTRRKQPSEAEKQRQKEAESLTVFGARSKPEVGGKPKYLGLILTLALLVLMALAALWTNQLIKTPDEPLFNPSEQPGTPPIASPSEPATPQPTPPEPNSTPGVAPAPETPPTSTTPPKPEPAPEPGAASSEPPIGTGQPLTPAAAAARYAATGIWERAPDVPPNPSASVPAPTDLGTAPQDAAPAARSATPLDPGLGGQVEPTPPGSPAPPAADTKFDLDANGLVVATRDGALSPTGVLVTLGTPFKIRRSYFPARPTPPETPFDTTLPPPVQVPGTPKTRPLPRPAGLIPQTAPAAPETPETPATPEAPETSQVLNPAEQNPSDVAQLPALSLPRPAARPADLNFAALPDTPLVDPNAIDAAVAESAFAGATAQAVTQSPRAGQRPSNFSRIVASARAAASDGSFATAAAVPAAASATPAIPTRADVARRATTENALNLRKVNLIGIYGTANARRALVRLENGRYVKVKVGDRLDGGKVTSISSQRLTYQRGNRAYTLELLPLS